MSSLRKKNIGIIFGGESNEHDVSIASSKAIYKAFNSKLNLHKFNIKVFYINKHGVWFNNADSKEILKENKNAYAKLNEQYEPSNLNFLENIDFSDIEIWFPVIHGSYGEDGTIQGLLKFTKKPFIGSGILGSSLGMDKIAMKLILSDLKIPQVKYVPIDNFKKNDTKQIVNICTQIVDNLSFPLFIKPANSGSSIGITKVNCIEEISSGLQIAGEIDNRIIIEEGHEVRELECGVIGRNSFKTTQVGEINYSSDWYNYESKYSIKNKVIIPANIDPNIEVMIKDFTIRACKALNIYGFARADFFLDKLTNSLFLNEINTIPGFTNQSMFPMLWSASGLEIDKLVATLVEIAIES